MKNKEILDMNDNKKWDWVVQNPPYGITGGHVTHLKFVDKCLELADKQIVLMPFNFVKKVNQKGYSNYKNKLSKTLTFIEEVDSNFFNDISMNGNVGIYVFNNDKKNNNIIIHEIDNKEYNVKSLEDISEFNEYESQIISYLSKHNTVKKYCSRGAFKYNDENFTSKKLIEIKQYLNDIKNYAILIVEDVNFKRNGVSITDRVGQIITNIKDLTEFFIHRKSVYNLIIFNSIKEAENCKIALQHPLLRFTVYRTQNDQHMGINRVYKYIPNIDWEDDRVKTDDGLLEVCGCPKDKCKEYADYCKKIIDDVDKIL